MSARPTVARPTATPPQGLLAYSPALFRVRGDPISAKRTLGASPRSRTSGARRQRRSGRQRRTVQQKQVLLIALQLCQQFGGGAVGPRTRSVPAAAVGVSPTDSARARVAVAVTTHSRLEMFLAGGLRSCRVAFESHPRNARNPGQKHFQAAQAGGGHISISNMSVSLGSSGVRKSISAPSGVDLSSASARSEAGRAPSCVSM
jgi:hypothetical protein